MTSNVHFDSKQTKKTRHDARRDDCEERLWEGYHLVLFNPPLTSFWFNPTVIELSPVSWCCIQTGMVSSGTRCAVWSDLTPKVAGPRICSSSWNISTCAVWWRTTRFSRGLKPSSHRNRIDFQCTLARCQNLATPLPVWIQHDSLKGMYSMTSGLALGNIQAFLAPMPSPSQAVIAVRGGPNDAHCMRYVASLHWHWKLDRKFKWYACLVFHFWSCPI